MAISKSLIRKLPKSEQDTPDVIAKTLHDQQSGICYLCEGEINLAADDFEADHDIPENEGGATELANLQLAHRACNRAKRNMTTAEIRPYLKLRRFMGENGARLKYDGLQPHFDIQPKSTQIEWDEANETVDLQFGDGSSFSTALLSEPVGSDPRKVKYCFVPCPPVALFNDEEVQPRMVRHDHVFSIYNDLLKNPLHEAPGCRLHETTPGSRKILMFDGQHKTIASWMLGRERVVVKLYLDLTVDQANFLVNSIQAKIKKLPLSAFELAGKMADEWQNKVEEYETDIGIGVGSEKGFIDWIPAADRPRARSAFKAALEQAVLGRPDFRLMHWVREGAVTESMVKTKCIDRMLFQKPLEVAFSESTALREDEVENTIMMLNKLVSYLPERDIATQQEPEDIVTEIRRRFFKQGSMQHTADLLRKVFSRELLLSDDDDILAGSPNPSQMEKIDQGIKNIAKHPVWTARLDRDERMAAVKLALEKNQNVTEAFEAVGLTFAYVVIGSEESNFKKLWRS